MQMHVPPTQCRMILFGAEKWNLLRISPFRIGSIQVHEFLLQSWILGSCMINVRMVWFEKLEYIYDEVDVIYVKISGLRERLRIGGLPRASDSLRFLWLDWWGNPDFFFPHWSAKNFIEYAFPCWKDSMVVGWGLDPLFPSMEFPPCIFIITKYGSGWSSPLFSRSR